MRGDRWNHIRSGGGTAGVVLVLVLVLGWWWTQLVCGVKEFVSEPKSSIAYLLAHIMFELFGLLEHDCFLLSTCLGFKKRLSWNS